MSKSSNSKRITRLLFVFVVSVALACADLVVLAQNENAQNSNAQDDTTRGGQMTSNTQNGNMTGNTGNTGTGGRRRRRRRSGGGNTNTSGEASGGANISGDMSGNANMTAGQDGNANAGATVTTGGRRRRRRGRRTVTTDTTGGAMTTTDPGAQRDLSGQFSGTVDYEEGGLKGPANLNFSSNPGGGYAFTITPETGTPVSGRATAVTTRGYTAVTMMFGDPSAPPAGTSPPPLPAVSLRARWQGDRVTLMSVPGERRKFSFTHTIGGGGGGSTGGRRRRRRSRNRMSNMGGAGATTNANMGGETNTNTTNSNTTPPQ